MVFKLQTHVRNIKRCPSNSTMPKRPTSIQILEIITRFTKVLNASIKEEKVLGA